MLFAALDWQSVGVIFGITVSGLSAILVYLKGRKSDEALQSSSLVATAFSGQETLVRALQAEVGRHSVNTDKCLAECSQLRDALAKERAELSQAKNEIQSLRAILQQMLDKMKKAGVPYE
jgi:hypothetical protein